MAQNKKQQAAIAMSMKKKGSVPKGYHKMPDGKIMKNSAHKKPMKMEMGGSLKSVDSSKNPGLAKLPTEVRNKMGYQKYGGSVKMKMGGSTKSRKK